MYKGTALNQDTPAIDRMPASFGRSAWSALTSIAMLLGGLYLYQGGVLPF